MNKIKLSTGELRDLSQTEHVMIGLKFSLVLALGLYLLWQIGEAILLPV